MLASRTAPSSSRRWITDADVLESAGSATIASEALLADRLKPAREKRPTVTPGGWVVAIQFEPPAWVEPTVQALADLLTLPPGWDSYGANAVDPWHVWATFELLSLVMRDDTPAPVVCPTNRGGVQVEWHTRGIDLEIESLSTYRFRVSFEDAVTGHEWDGEVGGDLGRLIESIACFSGR